ncbi:PREDICTED: probable cytochrome P450 6a13 [Vollenhovia emeryi]|uniref:probable cytochrome P450 6a13 n=1 Tax=Vollenhovia emeryi TaxID=411798 RepID=UPI0005F46988|nr:PREDICTED: probable cytochrome P450 6a13 [Vollenhovia emeryi]
MIISLLLLTLVFLIVIYVYLTKNYKFWQKRGVPYADGALPGVGHLWDVVTMKTTISECYRKIYNENQDHSMVGVYSFQTPVLMVREPELVKTVLQTSFGSFHDNAIKINPKLDPLFANNPFCMYGDKWMAARKRLTYAFSSMRLKILFESVKQVCETLEEYVNKKLGKSGKVEFELKELFAKFTAQVVSGIGFGVDGLCFNDERAKESFYAIGNSFLEPTAWNNFISSLVLFVPPLADVFKVRLLPKKADRFFREIIANVIEERRKESTPRNDFLQLMVDLERAEGEKLDLEVLTSHAVSFFLDGYETSSTTLSYVAFNLANKPEVQEKLREEVISVLNKYNGKLTYEALREMTYMDQVISESQRILPTVGLLNKVCTEDTELRGSDGLVCRVERGTPILIPIYGLQHDPRYWKDPKVFDPDRFGPERKQSLERFAFLPFGDGPRQCVGMRMALLQMKAGLVTFLKKYTIELSPKMQLPLKITGTAFLTAVEGGIWGIIRPIQG